MPPRLPARALSSLPLSYGAVASSSTLPPPPRPSSTSPRQQSRSLSSVHKPCRSSPELSPPTERISSCRHAQQRSFHTSAPARATAKDPYDVLGVKKDSSAGDIKKAYYQLAKKWHPDSNKDKGANERFVEVQSAYDILSDDNKRQAYDRYGSAATEEGFNPDAFAGGAGGFGGFQGFGGDFGGRPGSAGDLFESLFGGSFGAGGGGPFSGGGARARRGDDIEATVTLSFLEACKGVARKLTIFPVVDCKPCSGNGLKAGQKKTQCGTCKGTGQQTFSLSGMMVASTCQACGGAGETIPRGAKCRECDGLGRMKDKREEAIEIPAGIEDGMKVKIPGGGDMPLSAGGGIPGDLFVRVNVRSSPVFRRQGTNVYHDAKIPLHTALLGGRVRVPTLEGDVEVRVREGTQNAEEAVLKGRGVKSVYGLSRDRGDLVVGWRVQIPRSLSSRQKQILQAFADDVEGREPAIHFGPLPQAPSVSTEIPQGPESTVDGKQSEANVEATPGTGTDTAEGEKNPEQPVGEAEPEGEPEEEKRQATG